MSLRLSVLKNVAVPYVVSTVIHIQSLGEKERSYITQHYGEELTPNSRVCKAHNPFSHRNHAAGDPFHTWK